MIEILMGLAEFLLLGKNCDNPLAQTIDLMKCCGGVPA